MLYYIFIRIILKYIFALLVFLPLYAGTYPEFNQNELQKIKKENPISSNRIVDYTQYLTSCKSYPPNIQLNKINFYLNRLLPQYDDVINNKLDNWATPKEFLRVGYGDCEDYVIIKYYSLIKLGFDEKKLYITVVKENFHGGGHMVLCYFKTKNEPPLVLDNLSFKILSLEKRSDLSAQVFINSTGVYKIMPDYELVKISNKYKKFENLKKRVKENH